MCTFDQHYQTVGKKYNTHDSITHMPETLKWPSLQNCKESPRFILTAIKTCKKFSQCFKYLHAITITSYYYNSPA